MLNECSNPNCYKFTRTFIAVSIKFELNFICLVVCGFLSEKKIKVPRKIVFLSLSQLGGFSHSFHRNNFQLDTNYYWLMQNFQLFYQKTAASITLSSSVHHESFIEFELGFISAA